MSLVTLVWKPAIRLGEWTCVFLRMSTDGQLLLKKPIQECMHCQNTATRVASGRFTLVSLLHLKKVVDNCFSVEWCACDSSS